MIRALIDWFFSGYGISCANWRQCGSGWYSKRPPFELRDDPDADLRRRGWERRNFRWLCPKCVEADRVWRAKGGDKTFYQDEVA